MRFLAVLIIALAFLIPAAQAQTYSNIGLEVSPDSVSVCPCSTINSVRVTVTNNDDITHIYDMSMELPEKWTGFIQPKTPAVQAGKSFVLEAFYVTPNCYIEPGDYIIPVTANDGQEKKTVNLNVEILECHGVKIVTEPLFSICKGSSADISAEIRNIGKITETFEVTVTSSWGDEILAATFDIDSEESEEIEFTVIPPEESKSHFVMIEAESKDSYAYDKADIQIDVENCFDFEIGIEPESEKICLGNFGEFMLMLQNTGSEKDTYTLSAPSWVSLMEEEVTLDPEESVKIEFTATPPDLGDNEISLKATSSGDIKLSKQASASLRADECRGVAVIMSPTEAKACRSASKEFEVKVKNIGTSEDTFILKASEGELEEESLTLEAGETGRTTLTVKADTDPGETIEVVVSAETEDGRYEDSDHAMIEVENCYGVSIAVDPEEVEKMCMGDEVSFELEVSNTGRFDDTYTVTIGETKHEDVQIPAGGKEVFSETMVPSGDMKVIFRAESDYASDSVEVDLSVMPAEECYSVIFSDAYVYDGNDNESFIQQLTTEIGLGKVIVLTLKNNGSKVDTYRLDLEAPEWIFQQVDEVTLEPGQEKDLYVYIAPTFGVEFREYTITQNAESDFADTKYSFEVEILGEGEVITGPDNVTINVSLPPTGGIIEPEPPEGGEPSEGVDSRTRVILLAVIVILIIIILAVKFILFLK